VGFLDHLWSGWRGEYVATVPSSDEVDTSEPSCVFCTIIRSGEADTVTNVVRTGHKVVVLLNAYPYSTGHVMVMPRRHVDALEALDPDEAQELWATVTQAVATQRQVYSPEGFNVGLNLGRAAGAGLPGHLHVHVVPRWGGDTNFMTAVANTRVLPEALEVTRTKLADAWPDDPAASS
jgi:ATP adenylyltransferase